MFIIDAPDRADLAVEGSDRRFPIGRIFCVGRNYAAHAREFGNDPDRDPPFFFMKPADCVVEDGATLPYPPGTSDLHYEGEMVVALGAGGRDIAVENALDAVWGYGVGNDLTRRDMQQVAKDMRRPWDLSKGFDGGAAIAPLRAAADVGHPATGFIRSSVNGELRQDGDLAEMIWKTPEMIAYLSGLIELKPGDLILTGTPAGVGSLSVGDVCTVEIEGLGALTTTIGAAR